MNPQEHYKSEREIQDELTEQYGIITIAGLEFDSGRILREFDEPFFNEVLAESLQWECDICGALYDEDDKESAESCCKEEFLCAECGDEPVENDGDLCDDCQALEDEEFENEESDDD